ncbi:DUF4942 domain-containing protein [Paenibacillus sp. JSM ZJ436]|uniref:DUF4942 domain-containing protein n=1 Tax=Paenibacillus sp. JSM ZJ436 TaxID=3376190 RepID=UPI0037931603
MYYGDKREAKVRIMGKLVETGWKVYGYTPDQSDAMTDYYSPAHWSGIATKNGFVLLVDVYGTSDSGREIRKYDYSKKVSTSSRIEKLTAMMNDAASTENEKASCAVLIEKEMEKANVKPSYTVVEVYPTYAHANPKGSTWHIEKDGQIIAKGKGVFSTNTYDWENTEKSSSQQKEEKVNKFVNRVEKVLQKSDALQAVVIKVPVKVTKIVEKDVTNVDPSDMKEGFTFIMKVGYTHGKNKGNKYTYVRDGLFSKLGKNNKPSKSYDKMWSLPVERMNQLLAKGHIAVIEFVEVTEYQEKTVFKKTARKQTVSDSPQIETTEEVIVNKSEQPEQPDQVNESNVTVKLNEELNGIELYFADIPSVGIREQLKANGFRWSRKGFWYAKQSEDTITLANSLRGSEKPLEATEQQTEPQTAEQESETEHSNVIYQDFKNENNKQEEETLNNNSFDDMFSKFDNIDMSAEQKTNTEDATYCKAQEEIYKKLLNIHNSLITQLQDVQSLVIDQKFDAYSTAYCYSLQPRDIKQTIKKMKDKFISAICYYFMNKYNVTIDYDKIQKKYDIDVTHENIIDEIKDQLGGYNFQEKAEQEIKEKLRDAFSWKKPESKGKKIVLDGFLYIDSSWKKWGEERIHYNSTDKLNQLFKAIQHFEDGSTTLNNSLQNLYTQIAHEKNEKVFGNHELTFTKVKSIKVFKNGKVEIEFTSNQYAEKFNKVYCLSNAA